MVGPLVFPIWLRLSLVLPLFALNLWVLRQLLLPLAPFPALFLTAALIAFLLDIPSRWLNRRGLPRWLAIVVVAIVTLGLLVLAAVALNVRSPEHECHGLESPLQRRFWMNQSGRHRPA